MKILDKILDFMKYHTIISGIIICAMLCIFILAFLFDCNQSFSCPQKSDYCVVKEYNLYGLHRTRKIFLAKDIVDMTVEGYFDWVARIFFGRGSIYYKIIATDKSGREKYIWKYEESSIDAEITAQHIMDCIRSEKYPCMIEY